MARLNDTQGAGPLEALKRRFIRQNVEIARVNSTQSTRIRELEDETTRLLIENIELREQVIKLQASLDRREKARVVVESVEATKKRLEEKVAQLEEIIRELGRAITTSPEGKSTVKKVRVRIIPRGQGSWGSQVMTGEIHDDLLPAIHEDARSSRSSLIVEEDRRSSLNFEEISLPPPRSEDDIHDNSNEDLGPLVPRPLDIRPRRRRDSVMASDLGVLNKPVVTSKTQPPAPSNENTISKASKRKFEREAEAVMEFVADMGFKFSRRSERPIEAARPTGEAESAAAAEASEGAKGDQASKGKYRNKREEDVTKMVELMLSSDARKRKEAHISTNKEYSPPIVPAISTSSRRALVPKSTNSDTANSPLKHASIASTPGKTEKGHDKFENVNLNPPPMKAHRSSHARDTDQPPPDAEQLTNVRASRRAKSEVNYALPNLRDKMRRDDKAAEAARGEGKTQKRSTVGRPRSKGPAVEGELKFKREDPEDAHDEGQWQNLPPMPPATQASRSGGRPRNHKETGIGGLLERKQGKERERREKELESGPHPSAIPQRKRRTSSLHCPLDGMKPGNEEEGRSRAVSGYGEGKRKTVTTEGPDPSINYNNRTSTDTSANQRTVHSNLPPPPTDLEDGEEILESVGGSRRVTLGGGLIGGEGVRVVRGIKSSGDLMDEDGGDDKRRRLALPGPGIGVRRRSMML